MLKIVRFFLGLIIISPMMMFSMDNKKYTVGLKISNDTYAGQEINPAHMTITYLGTADENKLEKAKTLLSAINLMRPIKLRIGSPDTFGTQERPVPVRRLEIEQPKIEEKLIGMHQELGECEPFQPEKLDTPNWHVSAKDPKLQDELSNKAKKQIMLIGGKLFIKPLGPFEPIATFE